MKKFLFALAALSLLMACTPEENGADNNQSGNGGDKIVHVTGISLDRNSATIKEGEYITLVATVTPSNADNKSVSWSSSSDAVATVDASGKVTGVKAGSATITATTEDGGKKATCAISVEANDGTVHVTGISLDRPTATVKEGESITLIATVTPANAKNKNITWTTSSEAVASVDNNGKVTGVKAGNATITATTEDGGKKATCALSVKANMALSVTVDANHVSAISAVLAGKANLGSTVASDLKVGFQYSKSSGILPSNSTTVEATDADASYNYTAAITSLEPATTYYFRSFVRQNGQDTYGETKEFATKDVASLIETRDASGVEAAKATLNAKLDLTDVQYKTLAYGFLWGTSESALNTDVKCTEIKDSAISTPLTSLSHKTQYWYKAYVTLDSQTFYGEVKTFTTDVVPVESVSLDKTEYTFNTIGNTLTLTATVLPADATDKSVSWSSDKEDVATVDANGRVTAKGNGKATITVTANDGNGAQASCDVEVKQYVTSITLSKTSLSLMVGNEETISVTSILPENANDKSYTWSSTDKTVADIDQNGKITVKAEGKTKIKAMANDGSGIFASCEVRGCPIGSIDLGLSVLWATCNLNVNSFVSSSEMYGDYYAWGETSPYYSSQDPLMWEDGKTGYDWASYSLCSGTSSTLTRYNNKTSFGTIDNKKEFKDYNYEDDAARKVLGGKWRIPTDEEWTELRNNCTWIWTDNYNGTGVAGRIVTSKKNGFKDKSIFLPCAGNRDGTNLIGAGLFALYWSSSLDTGEPACAWYVSFNSYSVTRHYTGRCFGLSVRPVSE